MLDERRLQLLLLKVGAPDTIAVFHVFFAPFTQLLQLMVTGFAHALLDVAVSGHIALGGTTLQAEVLLTVRTGNLVRTAQPILEVLVTA